MRSRTGLLIAFALAAMFLAGCSSSDQAATSTPEKAAITLTDFENIGFIKEEDKTITWTYQGVLEGWDGTITVNGASQFLEVLVFDDVPDENAIGEFKALAEWVGASTESTLHTATIHNVMFVCHAQEVCDYVDDKLR